LLSVSVTGKSDQFYHEPWNTASAREILSPKEGHAQAGLESALLIDIDGKILVSWRKMLAIRLN